jgi:hypothetical protein
LGGAKVAARTSSSVPFRDTLTAANLWNKSTFSALDEEDFESKSFAASLAAQVFIIKMTAEAASGGAE